MKLSYLIVPLIGLLLTCCSHRKPYPQAMQQAESCIVTHPDSALSYLSSLETSIKAEPEETRMYYALLTIKAKDKQYITHTSDSLIQIVTRFYEDYGDADKQMEAYYYMGSIYRDMADAPRAIKAFQQAIDAGKGSNRYDILKRIYGQIGTLFAYQGLYEDALLAYKDSYRCYQKGKDEEGVAFALRNIARAYDSTNRQDSAICYYEKACRKAVDLEDKSAENDILGEFGCFCIRLNKFDLAKDILLKNSSLEKKANALWGLGRIYQNASQEDSAKYYFHEALQYDNIYVKKSVYQALSKMNFLKGNYPVALDYAYKSQEQADSIKEITKTEAVSKVHSLYNYQHTEKENQKLARENEKKKIHIYQLTLILVVIISIALWSTFYLRRKKEEAVEREKKIYQLKADQYANSLNSIEDNKQTIKELEQKISQLKAEQSAKSLEYKQASEQRENELKAKIDQLNASLFLAESQTDSLKKVLAQSQKELLEASNRKIQASLNEKDLLVLAFKKSEIYLHFHSVHNDEELKITEEKWIELRAAIDSTYSNFTNQLYTLYPQLSKRELHICYLIKISMQVKDIARLVICSTPTVSACRIRLYRKIYGKEGTVEMMDNFILDL